MARKPSTSSKPQVDAYQVVTDAIVEMLETGTAPWHKPWDEIGGGPMKMSNGQPYQGINILLLQVAALKAGYTSPWWGSYKEIVEKRGGSLAKQHGTRITFWKMLRVEDEKNPGKQKTIPLLKTLYVFNADQNQNDADLGLPEIEARPEIERIEACELALKEYYATGPNLRFGCDAAYYTPSMDTVSMPAREVFHSTEELYGTWFHETVHSTGHSSRLARKDLLEAHRFGDASYSREELVAEMGAAFLAGRTGIATKTLPNSAAYLASWIKALKGDKKLLVSAAGQAQKAVALILGENKEEAAEEASA